MNYEQHVYTVLAYARERGVTPFTIGSYSSLEKAEAAIKKYFGIRAVCGGVSTISRASFVMYYCDDMTIDVVGHCLDDEPNA